MVATILVCLLVAVAIGPTLHRGSFSFGAETVGIASGDGTHD
jgi:hypothetical protein